MRRLLAMIVGVILFAVIVVPILITGINWSKQWKDDETSKRRECDDPRLFT